MRFSYNRKQILFAAFVCIVSAVVWFELVSIIWRNPHLGIFWILIILGLIGFLAILARFAIYYGHNFWLGEDGERSVDRILSNNLPASYYRLHDIVLPEKKGNIDETVISPFGIWTLEVKNSKNDGEITFENEMLYKNHYLLEDHGLKQAYAKAKSLEEHIRESLGLPVPVHPVLVFANPKVKVMLGFKRARGVYVIGTSSLRTLLVSPNLPSILTPQQCVAVSDELRKYTSTM